MQRSDVASIASRAANAAYQAAGGPHDFTWLQCLSPSEGGAAEMAEYVSAYPSVTAADVYRRAVRGQGACPWRDIPECLQVATDVFVAVVRGLEPRARRAIVKAGVEAVGTPTPPRSGNVIPIMKAREAVAEGVGGSRPIRSEPREREDRA